MNKYSLSIKWKFNEEFESWNMIIISDDSKEHVTEVIKNYQKTNNVEFESPVDLMDAICDEYGCYGNVEESGQKHSYRHPARQLHLFR